MTDTRDMHREAFREEARELLAELETSLLELEERPEDADLIGRVFRAMHTLKGSGAMFGFDEVSSFTHELETVFDLVRSGSLPVTKKLIDLTLAARDHIRSLVEASHDGTDIEKNGAAAIIAGLRKISPRSPEADKDGSIPVPVPAPGHEDAGEEITLRVRFQPPVDIASRGLDPLGFLDELRRLGDCTISCRTQDIPPLGDLIAESCCVSWDIILTTPKGLDAVKDIFLFIEDDSGLKIDEIDTADCGRTKLGEILVDRGAVKTDVLDNVLGSRKRLGEMLVDTGVVAPDRVQSALAEQQHLKTQQEKRQAAVSGSSYRVASQRMDSLVNLVGELVTIQARLSQAVSGRKNREFQAIAEEVTRLTAELRETAMDMRMVPIGTTFSKFKRLVRDLSRELGKDIELETLGAETELDKNVIDKLADPLVHLIRNSIDHGIEPPEARRAAGKSGQGTIRLSAVHSGANVLITVNDDGAGLDADAIRKKAVERGLIGPEAALSEKELYSLIFAPGFSTVEKVSSVSGRGVGMDVVKQAVQALRGSVEVDSAKGAGATVTLKLPLTMAIIEGLLARIADEYFVFPMSLVEECVELTQAGAAATHGRCVANIRGRVVPYIRLRESFSIGGAPPEREQIVITDVNGERVGFTVDNVIGEYQTVIKNLGRFYRDIEGVSGATILGNGRVALILDIQRLIRRAEQEEQYV